MLKKGENYKLDYYQQNGDYKSRIIENNKEEDIFPDDSSLRIWYNELSVNYSAHWHNALEIIVPIENYYDVEVDGESYHVMPGEIIIIPPCHVHTLHAPKTGCRYVCLVDLDFFSSLRGYSSLITMLQNSIHITAEKYAPIYTKICDEFTQVWNEYFKKTEFYEFSIYSHLFEIMTMLSRYHLSTINIFTDCTPAKRREYFEKLNSAIEYIDHNYANNITLDEVAAYSGFSKFHFSRLFKEYMNCTFYDYLINQRLKATEGMLERGSMPITDIALQSGFASISTFNRTFKQKKGCTPGEYRAYLLQR